MGARVGARVGAEVGARVGQSKANLFAGVLVLSAGRPVFTADYYAVDGVTGKVASFIDWNDATHVLAQATSARQVALPSAHADFAGKLCATFDHTVDSGAGNFYTSNRPASAWKFCTDGAGHHLVLTLTPTVIQAGQNFASLLNGNPALGVIAGGVATTLRVLLTNDAGAGVFDMNNTLALALNTPAYQQWSYLEGAPPPEGVLRRGGAIGASGNSSSAPGTNSPNATLTLGRRANGTSPSSMRWRNLLNFPLLADPQRDVVQQYELAVDGLAA